MERDVFIYLQDVRVCSSALSSPKIRYFSDPLAFNLHVVIDRFGDSTEIIHSSNAQNSARHPFSPLLSADMAPASERVFAVRELLEQILLMLGDHEDVLIASKVLFA